ncbi:MAG: rRNA maturation RNase YbeY [Ruminococcaceae bacterium]|nr:rRNA maturation RNase YbeY [Oscillospiraceae bacterium]
MVEVYFKNEQSKYLITPALKKAVRRAIRATLEYVDVRRMTEVSVTFTDNEKIHLLNKQYREKDAPTDVLSFPLIDWDSDEELPDDGSSFFPLVLGDIVISLEKAHAQAIEYDQSLIREVSFLTIHSTLHLLGYDHETSPEDEKEMFGIQDIVIGMLGI